MAAHKTIYEYLESQAVENEYKNDVLDHMSYLESTTKCDPDMMSLQPELQWHMRPYLLDFLIESHLGLQLNEETLFLAVSIVDRYSSKRVVFKRHYQLVGCAALWIASKYKDFKIKVPTLKELKTICCNMYEENMFVQMELHILETLEWEVGGPTPVDFLDMWVNSLVVSSPPAKYQLNQQELADNAMELSTYLCEVSMYSQELLGYTPSTVSRAAFKLALIFITLGASPSKQAMDEKEYFCFNVLAKLCTKPTACLERKYASVLRFVKMYFLHQQQHVQLREIGLVTPKPTPTKHRLRVQTNMRSVSTSSVPSITAYTYDNFDQCQKYMTPPVSPEENSPNTSALPHHHRSQHNHQSTHLHPHPHRHLHGRKSMIVTSTSGSTGHSHLPSRNKLTEAAVPSIPPKHDSKFIDYETESEDEVIPNYVDLTSSGSSSTS